VTASWHGLHEDDIHQDIPFLTMPTLLIGAERGDVITEGDVAEILDLNNKIRFTRVAAAGHMIPWDNFEGFFSALMPFLGEEPVRPVR
jgi:N-formylmaleamate deformylase